MTTTSGESLHPFMWTPDPAFSAAVGEPEPDWDAVAAEVGLPAEWRAEGYDTPEYMVSEDSIYRQDNGVLLCVWPGCGFRRRDVEAMFRHIHNPKLHGRPSVHSSETRNKPKDDNDSN